MKTKAKTKAKAKRILSALLVLSVLLLLISCSRAQSGGEDTESTSSVSEEASPFDYVSLTERSGWRDRLIARLTEQKSKASADQDFVGNVGVGLIDIDLDGTPEVAFSYPGGSAGNTFFILVDMDSGEEVGSFSPGWYGDKHLGELAIFLDTELNRYSYVGVCNYREGWDTLYTLTYTVSYKEALSEYDQDVLFEAIYRYDIGSSGEIEEPESSVEHYIGGKRASHEDYVHESALFWQRAVKIPESDFVHIEWDNVEGESGEEKISAMADALINSTQVFIRGEDISSS